MSSTDPKDLRIVRLEALLSAARDSLAGGLETPGELEAEGSVHDRALVADIDAELGRGKLAEVLTAAAYGPGRYAFRVGDMPEAVMRLPNMQNPDTLVEFFGENLEGAHLALNRYMIERRVFSDGKLAPPVARYKPNNIRKRDRKN